MACPRASDGGDVLKSSKVEVEVGEDESARRQPTKPKNWHTAHGTAIPNSAASDYVISSAWLAPPIAVVQAKHLKSLVITIINLQLTQDFVCCTRKKNPILFLILCFFMG
jgi:hypothetical protein